ASPIIRPGHAYPALPTRFRLYPRFHPGQRHGYGSMSDYWFWLRAEYFVKHLLGDYRWDVNINQLNNEQPQTR
ncbi:MAG: hypothetical protein EBR20_10230, partial [Bacteroidetes bacterium]|nr:hypothetical protein [Bacteroidota bacterium]